MNIEIIPSKMNGEIIAPPSKSILHRAIICAALANGESILSPVSFCDDINATLEAVKQIGATVSPYNDGLKICGINGDEGLSKLKKIDIFCDESCSTLRFFIPIMSLTGDETRFLGSERLLTRPQTPFMQMFFGKNITFNKTTASIFIHGKLTGGKFIIKGDVSSQFISGMLFALPLVQANSTINIMPPFCSKPYVDLTLDVLAKFGIKADMTNDKISTIKLDGKQQYEKLDFSIEGDWSNFAYFAVCAAIKGQISGIGIDISSLQGDKVILDILKQFGAEVTVFDNSVKIVANSLTAQEIDIADCPDLGPILMVLAAFSQGETLIKNAQRLRIKECDRISAMEEELKKLNVDISSTNDTVTIKGRKPLLSPATVHSHDDHRIAMSLAVFAANCEEKITIENAECVKKSYPNFFEDLKKAGIAI